MRKYYLSISCVILFLLILIMWSLSGRGRDESVVPETSQIYESEGNPAAFTPEDEDICYVAEAADEDLIDPKTAYLTFDDGPSYLTPKVLDCLDEYGVKATFFVTYQPQYEELYRQIVERGHAIGVHSASHEYGEIYSSFENWLSDFNRLYDYIYECTGVYPEVYRFPGGSCGVPCKSNKSVREKAKEFLDEKGISYFDWNVECGDGGYVTVSEAYRRVVSNIKQRNHPVILMHDGVKKENTLSALPDTLKTLIEWGYSFETLDNHVLPVRQGSCWDYSLTKTQETVDSTE